MFVATALARAWTLLWAALVVRCITSFIAWRSTAGAEHSGVVTFDALDRDTTKVTVILDYQPHSFAEYAGYALGAVGSSIKNVLSSFCRFIEARSNPTGSKRGRIYEHYALTPYFQNT